MVHEKLQIQDVCAILYITSIICFWVWLIDYCLDSSKQYLSYIQDIKIAGAQLYVLQNLMLLFSIMLFVRVHNKEKCNDDNINERWQIVISMCRLSQVTKKYCSVCCCLVQTKIQKVTCSWYNIWGKKCLHPVMKRRGSY